MDPSILTLSNNDTIYYHKMPKNGTNNLPYVVFCGGFMSDMSGTKAVALEEYCQDKGYGYIRFDYFGHGQSSGEFTDGTIGKWKENVLSVIDELTEGPVILIGSSMGGWVSTLAAIERKDRVAGLVTIAAAPDFTSELMWDQFDEATKKQLQEGGVFEMGGDYGDDPYPITYQLIEDGQQHHLLDDVVPLTCPVRLIHGMKDADVPYMYSVRLAEKLKSEDVQVHLIKKGDHRMSTEDDLQCLFEKLDEMLAICSDKR